MSAVADPFAQLRPALAPSLREASPAEIRAELARQGIDAEAAEDFFGALGRAASSIGNAVGPRLGSIGQGALQGAMTGMALGPVGAIAGAIGGGALGGLSGPPRPGSRAGAGGGPAAGLGSIAGLLGGGGGGLGGIAGLLGGLGGAGRGGGGGPAASLMGLFTQPQVLQALMSMVVGPSGARTVPIGGQPVPVAAIPNMIAHFAQQAATEWEQAYGVPEAATLPGLPEFADSATRAQALADAIAAEAVARDATEARRNDSGGDAGKAYGQYEAAELEAEWTEATEGYYASYDPVYVRA